MNAAATQCKELNNWNRTFGVMCGRSSPCAAQEPGAGLPVFVPTFNCLTYLPSILRQLRRVQLENIIILDNDSRFPPFLELLSQLEQEVTVVRLNENKGPRHVFLDPEMRHSLPQYFCVTDPDLVFNDSLPADFVSELRELTSEFQVGKAGFALDISDPTAIRDDVLETPSGRRYRIWEWEEQFWQYPVGATPDGDPVYRAAIDTTFAVYNKAFFDPADHVSAVRVAGRFTCRHLPWYKRSILDPIEDEYYRRYQRFSCFTQPLGSTR